MPSCPYCGWGVGDEAAYCPDCGNTLPGHTSRDVSRQVEEEWTAIGGCLVFLIVGLLVLIGLAFGAAWVARQDIPLLSSGSSDDGGGYNVLPDTGEGASTSSDRMLSGQQLSPGQSITSTNGCFRFIYQTDGNLVLYRTSSNVALWASNTERTSVRNAIMRTDGNLVVYNASGSAVWASNTNGSSGSWLIAQDDGNVVIYRPNGGPAIWATNTVRSC